jgi:O-antigen ligase
LVLAALALVIVWQSSGGMLAGRLRGTFNAREETAASYGSAQQRQQLFWRSIEVTMEHPLFGVGPGNFSQISGAWHATHNSFTQMSSEGGIPAFTFYVLILWCGFKNLRATKRLARERPEARLITGALLASLMGYVVGSTFLTMGYQFFAYTLVAYSSALLSIVRKSGARSRTYDSVPQVAFEKQSYVDTPAPDRAWHAT